MKRFNTDYSDLITHLYVEEYDHIYAIFRQARIPVQTCEDLTQDAFVKLLGFDFIVGRTAKSLLCTIAYRMRIDYLRHQFFIHHMMDDNADMSSLESYSRADAIEVEQIAGVERWAVSRCSDLDAKVYTLSRFCGKTTGEIAREIHISGRAVEARLYRSRKFVRESVAKVVNA